MIYDLLRPILFRLDPERAHALTIASLRWAQRLRLLSPPAATGEPVRLMGLSFANRVGLAAGFDKNAACVDGLGALGFGFVEVGTVTPRPQSGNPRPRVFRLREAQAIVNRMGFPNEGAAAACDRLGRRGYPGILGVNIGKNAATPLEQAAQDYLLGLRAVYPVADYVAVNVSSPNTAGLRRLLVPELLEPLLEELLAARTSLTAVHGKRVPLLLKISPDLSEDELRATAQVIVARGIDGIIATNTTVARPSVAHLTLAGEAGGLSGPPLAPLAVASVRTLRRELPPHFPIIGVGGIDSVAAARAMREAGADLLQLYTGLVYRGPRLVRELARV